MSTQPEIKRIPKQTMTAETYAMPKPEVDRVVDQYGRIIVETVEQLNALPPYSVVAQEWPVKDGQSHYALHVYCKDGPGWPSDDADHDRSEWRMTGDTGWFRPSTLLLGRSHFIVIFDPRTSPAYIPGGR